FLNHNCATSNSYYFDRHGDAPMLRPSTSLEMLWRAKHLPMTHYKFSGGDDQQDVTQPEADSVKGKLELTDFERLEPKIST
ncbi:MAG: hypothetical protein WBA20_07050, partial [Ketobacter sp.]